VHPLRRKTECGFKVLRFGNLRLRVNDWELPLDERVRQQCPVKNVQQRNRQKKPIDLLWLHPVRPRKSRLHRAGSLARIDVFLCESAETGDF